MNGVSTQMPSVQLDLGRYVTVRPRKDGTARVLFEVPARLRPSGWSKTTPLPVHAERRGDLTDGAEVAAIQADAKRLLAQLRAARMGREIGPPDRSIPALVRSWQSTQRFKNKKPTTQKGYQYHAGLVEAWAKSRGNREVSTLTLESIEKFLGFYDDRPTTRRHVKIVLSMLMDRAIQLKWRTDNPLATIKMGAPKSKVTIWERADVEHYRDAALLAGQPSIAAMILTLWETGQRITDARLFRLGAEFRDGTLRFHQSKTGAYVTIPVSPELRAELEAIASPESLYLFTDRATGKPWASQRLSHVFGDLRNVRVADEKGRKLVLRALRHSCVVQMARAGSDVPEIASITGHAPATAAALLGFYLPQDSALAMSAQRRRGLVSGNGR